MRLNTHGSIGWIVRAVVVPVVFVVLHAADIAVSWSILLLFSAFIFEWIWNVHSLMTTPRIRGDEPEYILHTLTISHFSEQIRWLLDRLQVKYVEEQDAGGIGVLFLGRTVPALYVRQGRYAIKNTGDIIRFLRGKYGHCSQGAFLRVPTATATAAEVDDLERLLHSLGVCVQRVVYSNIIYDDPALHLRLWGANQSTVPRWQQLLLRASRPLLVQFLKFGLRANKKFLGHHLEKTNTLLEDIEKTISELKPGTYLFDSKEPSYVDIILTTLAAPLFQVQDYWHGGKFDVIPSFEEFPKAVQDVTLAMRQKYPKTFKYVSDMYSQHRS
jgi:glutathione S-transferase